MSLSEKVVIVTGSSRGIGKAMAMGLAEAGAFVVVAARSEESHPMLPGTIHSTVGEIEDAGGKALAVPTNVRDEESIRHLVNRTLDEFG
ncbi:MAG: SDR family NAD(P)-dependent oxidoreductase, partial [Chloroflexota bacterium]|nr:SDR family NAD(P)-dependent oxidoreductase [Chloroflexota bacterium]